MRKILKYLLVPLVRIKSSMGQIMEYVKIALLNIKNNKGRSVLTMLGIIIGIASVIMIIAIGNGVRTQINNELDGMGSGQLYIYVDNSQAETPVEFTQDDIDLIKDKVDNVKGVTTSRSARGRADGPKGSFDARVDCGTADFQYSMNDPLVMGRYFTEGDYQSANRVCIITESSARSLFGNTDVVGMSFELDLYGITQEVTIRGVRADNVSTLLGEMMGGNSQISVEMPDTVLGAHYGFWVETFSEMLIIADSPVASVEVAKQSVRLMESKYNIRGENQVMVQSFADISGQVNSIFSIITLFISMVAAISLLVGGIGVMNIMLVSVTERTREIGIRKALGARTASILTQFLAEAGIITLIGGVIGIVLGYLGGSLVCNILDFAVAMDAGTVAVATLFSSAVGIFFGIYPARKAARLSPIEALRHE